jgi:hypothetical protein
VVNESGNVMELLGFNEFEISAFGKELPEQAIGAPRKIGTRN